VEGESRSLLDLCIQHKDDLANLQQDKQQCVAYAGYALQQGAYSTTYPET